MCRVTAPNARYDESIMSTASPKPRRRWLRFSLRALLLIVTVLCIWIGIKVNAARRQRAAMAAMQRAGVMVKFDYQLPAPAWIRQLIGEEYFREVVRVAGDHGHISADDFARLTDFPELTELTLDSTKITQSDTERPIQDSDLAILESL